MTARLLHGSAGIWLVGIVAGVVGSQAALHGDVLSAGLLLAMTLLAVGRVMGLHRLRRRDGAQPADLATARRWERQFALGSFATSLLFGASNMVALSYRDPLLAMLVVCTLCCYVFSLILRTAVRPLVCLPSVGVTLLLTVAGFPMLRHESTQLSPAFAYGALATVAAVLVLTSFQLIGYLYRATLDQLMGRRDLIRFARRDPLTALNNRLALRERFEVLATEPGSLLALLYLDLDGFKPVNDRHGHQLGDALLQAVAARLVACLRSGEDAFRIGGDEFAVILSPVRRQGDVTALARRLLLSLSEPYALEGEAVRIGTSIGIAMANGSKVDFDDLAAMADAALYDAKRDGRGTYRFADGASSLRLIA